ncbi:MAG TPA: hypothetical protein VMP01_23155 [Pirellulaceae bacterium]|nr:hypothetical protein [Pirellulaceae bacterium]
MTVKQGKFLTGPALGLRAVRSLVAGIGIGDDAHALAISYHQVPATSGRHLSGERSKLRIPATVGSKLLHQARPERDLLGGGQADAADLELESDCQVEGLLGRKVPVPSFVGCGRDAAGNDSLGQRIAGQVIVDIQPVADFAQFHGRAVAIQIIQ